jgi:hypothetical protein
MIFTFPLTAKHGGISLEEGISPEKVRSAGMPESWDCVDCGVNTSPGNPNAAEAAEIFAAGLGAMVTIDSRCEVYTVKRRIWAKAGMEYADGCLCVGCLERRIGRKLRPRDFATDDALNSLPGTDRLLSRRIPREYLTEAA